MRRPGQRPGRLVGSAGARGGLLGQGLAVLLKSRPVLAHLATIVTPIAIVGAEVSSVRVEIAAIVVDVALIGADDLAGAAEIRAILLNGGPITRGPILLKLLLVLSDGLPVTVANLPIGAEILLVLPDVSRILSDVVAVLAQVALVAAELAPILMHLWIENGSGGLCAGARDPDGHRHRSRGGHGLPSIHVVLQWVSDAFPPVRREAADNCLPTQMSKS